MRAKLGIKKRGESCMFWKMEEDKPKEGKFLRNLSIIGGTALIAGFIFNRMKKSEASKKKELYHEIDLSHGNRRYFLAYQNANFEEESAKGYIWAPRETDSGRSIFHWDNLRLVRENDIVFSVVDRKIVSLNIARDNFFEYELDGVLGYRVDLEYNHLEEEIDVDDYMEDILELSPDKYAPFNVMGRSNSGYLFDIGEKLGEYLFHIIKAED